MPSSRPVSRPKKRRFRPGFRVFLTLLVLGVTALLIFLALRSPAETKDPTASGEKTASSVRRARRGVSEKRKEEKKNDPLHAASPAVCLSREDRAAFEALCKKYSGVSVAYYNTKSGDTFFYRENASYNVASVIKAPYCCYILQLADEGKCDLNRKMTYTSSYYAGGTGRIRYLSTGTQFTFYELISYAIRYSDNVAIQMLRSAFPESDFAAYAARIGIQDVAGIRQLLNGRLTASDALIYMKDLFRFLQTGTENAAFLADAMLHTTNPMIASNYPILRKYGWATASFHDMAIIDAPTPYILIILTNHENGTWSDFLIFRTLSLDLEKRVDHPWGDFYLPE